MRATSRELPWGEGSSQSSGGDATRPEWTSYDVEVRVPFDAAAASASDLRERVLACRRYMRQALDSLLDRIVDLAGHDPSECCRQELTASVRDVPILDLMQMIHMGRRSAIVDVRCDAGEGRLWCSGGELVDASIDRLEGVAAAYRILALEQGMLHADYRSVARPRLIRNSMHSVLLEAARRKDECAEITRGLGGLDSSWRATSPIGAGCVDDTELAIVESMIDGRSVRDLLAASRVGDLEVLRALAALVERGQLCSYSHPPTPSTPVERGGSTLPPPAVVTIPSFGENPWAVTAVVVAALVAASSALWRSYDAPPAGAAEPSPGPVAPSFPRDSVPTFPLRVSVVPHDAALWLDGQLAAIGEVDIDLSRDGRTHELLVRAAGYRPEVFLFRDLSPPTVVTLRRAVELTSPVEESATLTSLLGPSAYKAAE